MPPPQPEEDGAGATSAGTVLMWPPRNWADDPPVGAIIITELGENGESVMRLAPRIYPASRQDDDDEEEGDEEEDRGPTYSEMYYSDEAEDEDDRNHNNVNRNNNNNGDSRSVDSISVDGDGVGGAGANNIWATSGWDGVAAVDLRAFECAGAVDDNLVCPICKYPFVGPCLTGCEHYFCEECIVTALDINAACPVCRVAVAPGTVSRAPRIIVNQVDNVVVRCAHAADGCDATFPRSLAADHVRTDCGFEEVACPGEGCAERLPRRMVAEGCVHYEVACEACEARVRAADMDRHLDRDCPNSKKVCDWCGELVLYTQLFEHGDECPEVTTPCRARRYGCTESFPRRDAQRHEAACILVAVGELQDVAVAKIASQAEEIRRLNESHELWARRLQAVEKRLAQRGLFDPADYSPPGAGFPSSAPLLSLADAGTMVAGASASRSSLPTLPPPAPSDAMPPSSQQQQQQQPTTPNLGADDGRTAQFCLSLFDLTERHMDELRKELRAAEAREAVARINELGPVKDSILEIRNNLNVLGMHTKWLMNFRMQERSSRLAPPAAAAESSSSALNGSAGGSSGGGAGGAAGLSVSGASGGGGGGVGAAARSSSPTRSGPPVAGSSAPRSNPHL